MIWFDSLGSAMRALKTNLLRSALTMLGIVIGIAATIALVSLGRGVERYVVQQFVGLGTNLLSVSATPPVEGILDPQTSAAPLNYGDAEAIRGMALPEVAGVAMEYADDAVISRGANKIDVEVSGVTPEYDEVRDWSTDLGDFLTEDDYDQRSRVVVLGHDAAAALFSADEYPLGQQVKINGAVFRTVGVMQARGSSAGSNQDLAAFIPLSTAQDRLFEARTLRGEYLLTNILVAIRGQDEIDIVKEDIDALLRSRRPNAAGGGTNYTLLTQDDIAVTFRNIIGALTVFLGSIAAISLLVGGIGIMNIMLVSVTERTREIGLRKAVGAQRGDILLQFLTEAIVLAVAGGIVGTVLGTGTAYLISTAFDNFAPVVGVDAILLAVLVSVGTGLFFGIFPAYQASRKHPIDALRFES